MGQLIGQFTTTLSNIVSLYIWFHGMGELENMDEVEWLLPLHHFSTVQTLYVSVQLAGHVALAIKDITVDMVAEVLPSLALVRLEGRLASSVQKFVAVRQLSGRLVTVVPATRSLKKDASPSASKRMFHTGCVLYSLVLDLGAIGLVAHMVAVSPSSPVRVSARRSTIVGVSDL